ncbi:N-formylglutamate amidohydrolase [Kordiimonas lacus]|uniref:N-formylglutamate amidohydrolase n=1 Tax=Kordiimonas lacus TaxID=637679 RepID=A0A1G6YAL3_9PROT|nr:N-formylglutamate amidohydrolase [Kordiimonas lacus]SDD86615.1 N-formylglutamate amidohydrolase [Kordiimonas lacus]
MTEHSCDETSRKKVERPAPFLCRSAPTPGPFIFALPHSGRFYPQAMRSATHLSDHTLRLSEDAFVDKLFDHAPQNGATLLVATHARAYLDLNRDEMELDPSMFSPTLDEGLVHETHRVKAGLGIIPKLVAENVPIYTEKLPAREAFYRIGAVYKPYHDKLAALISARKKQFGYAALIDCHSMPSEQKTGRHQGPDIVLGDNWGSACSRDLTSIAEELLIRTGFRVRRNVPYSGGFTTQHYGNPNQGRHALQIEINRAIYMNENKIEPLPEFEEIREKLQWFSQNLISRFIDMQKGHVKAALPRAAE